MPWRILEESSVYRETAHLLECDRSSNSSNAFGYLVEFCLAQISILSVIAMPIGPIAEHEDHPKMRALR